MSASSARGAAGGALPGWRVFPVVALGVIMATLDASIVVIALPILQERYHVPRTTVEWVALAYSVTVTGLLLTSGRLADRLGRRRVYGAGLALFTLASLLCGLAPGVEWLIAARVVQGLGAALVSANGSAMLVSAFPAESRGRALGAFGAMVGVGLALGAPLGGLIIAQASWRWIFLLNVPLGLLTMLLLRRNVPVDRPPAGAAPVDFTAAALWCGTLVSLMLALTRGPAIGWSNPAITLLFVATAAMLAGFAFVESRAARPMLPPRILLGPLGAAVSLTLIGQALSVAVGFELPFYLTHLFSLGTRQTGMWNAVMPLAALVLAPVAGRLSDASGARVLTTLGLALVTVGFALLGGLGLSPAPWHLPSSLVLIGAGMGLFTVPNASALLSLVPGEQLGLASGLQNTARYLGTTGGIALVTALVASRYLDHSGRELGGGGSFDRLAYAAGFHDTCVVLTVLALVATLLAAAQRREGPARA